MKAKKMLIIYLSIVFPVISTCLILIISGFVTIFYSGFAIDSSGILYIGKDSKIEKYLDGKMIGSLSPKTSRGYAFTIQNDNTILLSTASTVYTLDLDGNVLNKQEDVGTKKFNELQKTKNTFISSQNKKYVMRSRLGRMEILSNEVAVYQMPVLDYIVKIAFFAFVLSVMAFVPIIVRRWRKCN